MQCRGIVGVPDLDHLTVLFNDTLFRLVKAEQDAHQGGFSRTVFAQQRMDLAPLQLKGNVVVRHYAGKFFSDIEHFNYVFRIHNLLALLPAFSPKESRKPRYIL